MTVAGMIAKRIYSSPIGNIVLFGDAAALCALAFTEENDGFGDGAAEVLPAFALAEKWLDVYFGGEEPNFMPPFNIAVSPFTTEVLEEVMKIPFGATMTYGELAARVVCRRRGRKVSPQAVGGALKRNPLPIMIPCHRVIGAKGDPIGYSGGIERKIKLLEFERVEKEPHNKFTAANQNPNTPRIQTKSS